MSQIPPVTTKIPPHPQLPPSWRWALLTAVAKLESGHTPSRKNPEYWGGDVPWLSLKDMQRLSGRYVLDTTDKPTMLGIENSSARLLPAGTVALCRTASLSVGKVAILGREMATSQDFVDWVCGPQLDPEFLYWALSCSGAAFDIEKQGSTHKTIYMPTLERLNVLLPPLDEQRRIATILDKADAVRRKRQEAIALTEQLLRSTFLEMFGDPITNPKRWPEIPLGETLALRPQIGTTKPAHDDGQYRVVRVGELGRRDIELEKCGRITLEKSDLERFQCHAGDILLARAIGSEELLGKASLVADSIQPIVFDSHVMRLRFNASRVLPTFFFHWLASAGGRARFLRRAGRTAVQFNVNAEQIREIVLPLPPLAVQQRWHEFEERVSRHSRNLEQAENNARDLFNSLVQRAFSGQL